MIQLTANQTEELDQEWLSLITQAYELGISSTEIKEFFRVNCQKESYLNPPPAYIEGRRKIDRSISF